MSLFVAWRSHFSLGVGGNQLLGIPYKAEGRFLSQSMVLVEPERASFLRLSTHVSPETSEPFTSAWDEDKCRNVLIRYCSHIPRNYQYRDGIPKVFLILREHMGDENLDLAGGVLYELIEVDCAHTDDPGASFQRWRFHHMQRHVGPLFILVARHIRRKLTIFEHFLD